MKEFLLLAQELHDSVANLYWKTITSIYTCSIIDEEETLFTIQSN